MKLIIVVILCVVIAGVLVMPSHGQQSEPDQVVRLVKDLRAVRGNLDATEALLDKLGRERSDLQGELVSMLDPSKTTENLGVICLLGEYRMDQAAPKLVAFLTMRIPPRRQNREALWSEYPAADALERIGVPGLSAVLAHVEMKGDDVETLQVAARVVRGVLKDKAVARLFVERAMTQQADALRRDYLKKLIEALDH